MSLAIDIDRVSAVLLADGWHEVSNNSFNTDAYEFFWLGEEQCAAGRSKDTMPYTGAEWQEADGSWMACPLTSVLAVRHRRSSNAAQ